MSKIIAAAIAAAFAGGAHAVTTYEFAFVGTQTHELNDWMCPGQHCDPAFITSTWRGVLVLTAPDGDGTFHEYTGLTAYMSGNGALWDPGMLMLDRYPGLTATVDHGEVTSLSGLGQFQFGGFFPTNFTFADMTMHYGIGQLFHEGFWNGSAPLTAVPEPSSWALLLAGLVAAGAVQKRRRA